MYVCVCVSVSLSECVRGIERKEVIGQNSPRFSRGEGGYFTLSEIIGECMEGDTCGVCCVFQLFKDILNVHKKNGSSRCVMPQSLCI